MKNLFFNFERRAVSALLILFVLTFQAFAQAPAAAVEAKLASVEADLVDKITVKSIKDMTAALAAPEMEGRGTGQPGGDKAANWITEKFKSFGLKPLGDKGSYLQKVEFKETTITPDTSFIVGEESLAHGSDFAFVPQNNGNKSVSGDMIFVSYGIQSKQAGIDMLAGANLAGKIVVMTEGPPPGFPEKNWTDQKAQQLIIGIIIRSGAVAIVIIGDGKEKSPPEESISYLSRRQITLPDEEGYPTQIPPFIYVRAKGAEKLFSKSGVTRQDALSKGASRDFRPIDLNQKAKIVAKYNSGKVAANNVVG